MKDLDKDIEKQIAQGFNEQDFDIQDAWLEDMSSKLDEHNKKNKRRFLFWLFPGVMVLSAAFLLWNTSNAFEKEKTNPVSVIENLEDNENLSSQKESYKFVYTELACEPHEILENKKETTKNKQNQKSNLKNKLNAQKNGSSNKNNFKGNFSTNNTLNKNKNLASLSSSTNNVSFENDKEQNSNTINTKKEEVHSEINSESKEIIKEDKNAVRTTNTLIASENKTEIIEKTIVKSTSENKEELKKEEASKAEKTNSFENAFVEKERTDSIQEISRDTTKVDKAISPKKDLGLSLAINAGPSFLFRNFKSENEKRTNEESNKVAWNLNLELYKTFKNNIILGTGINITNYGEKIDYSPVTENLKDTTYQANANNYFNLNISKIGQNIVYDTTAIIYHDTTLIITDSVYENTSVQKANGTTNFTYVEIPVLIGYRILDTKKWKINAMTGISTGFLIHSRGSYINDENQLEPATNTKVLFNYLLSAQLNYNVYKNINLSLSPNFKYNLNNASTIQGIKKRYYSFGVNAGVVIDF